MLRALPVLGLRVLQLRIHDLEGVGERDADPARDLRKPGRGFLAVSEVERRQRCQMIEDGLELDLLVEPPELMDALLQSLGDRQVERLDGDPIVRLGCGLPAQEQIVDLTVYEVAVALEVGLVDVQTRG